MSNSEIISESSDICECGHANPVETFECEDCGKPLYISNTRDISTDRYCGENENPNISDVSEDEEVVEHYLAMVSQ